MASFFLDPYSRPAEKRGGAWMDQCLGNGFTAFGLFFFFLELFKKVEFISNRKSKK